MLIYVNNNVIRYAQVKDFELIGQDLVPCIKTHSKNGECKLGYTNCDGIFKESPIIIGYVKICNIIVNSRREDHNILDNRYKYFFDYSIDIEIYDKKSNIYNYTITQSEERIGSRRKIEESRRFQLFEVLFTKLIPIINNYIESDLTVSYINQDSLNLFLACDNIIPDDIESHLLELVDKIWLSNENERFTLELFIDDSISFVDVFFIYKSLNSFPMIQNPKIIFPITEDDSKSYISKLFFNVFENRFKFDELYAITGLNTWADHMSPDFNLYTPSLNEARVCNFISRLKGKSEHVGQTRVGRDDCEYDYENIEIELKIDEEPSIELINMINKVIGHKLEYKPYSYKDHKGIYRWQEVSNREYVAGLACSTYDTGSYYMEYGNKLQIIKEMLRVKKNDPEEYNKWTI